MDGDVGGGLCVYIERFEVFEHFGYLCRVGIAVRYSLRFIGFEEERKGGRIGKCRFTAAVGRVGRESSAWCGGGDQQRRQKIGRCKSESSLISKDLLMPLQCTYHCSIAVNSAF